MSGADSRKMQKRKCPLKGEVKLWTKGEDRPADDSENSIDRLKISKPFQYAVNIAAPTVECINRYVFPRSMISPRGASAMLAQFR